MQSLDTSSLLQKGEGGRRGGGEGEATWERRAPRAHTPDLWVISKSTQLVHGEGRGERDAVEIITFSFNRLYYSAYLAKPKLKHSIN